MDLRAHHILCTVLYKGKGYSAGFVDNMNHAVDELKAGSTVRIITSPDKICSHCPNAREDGTCALDDENKTAFLPKSKDSISSFDSLILDKLCLTEGVCYSSSAIFELAKEKIDRDFFTSCCHTCRWYKEGLCNYDLYKERLDLFIK